MNLREIINRPDHIPVEQEEVLFVIKEYIKARKGKDIEPRIEYRQGAIRMVHEIKLANKMFCDAVAWFRN